MNTYICSYVVQDSRYTYTAPREIAVRATSKAAAKSIVRALLRQHGYGVLLKNINVLYIDNGKKPVNI